MEYQLLNDDARRAMWQQRVGAIEERHYALTMDRALALSVKDEGGLLHPEAQQRVRVLDEQIVAVAQQHAEAVRGLAALPPAGGD